MNRKQLQALGERYGVFITVSQLTDENMVKVGEEIRQLMRKWKMVADANFARSVRPKQKQSIDWDVS